MNLKNKQQWFSDRANIIYRIIESTLLNLGLLFIVAVTLNILKRNTQDWFIVIIIFIIGFILEIIMIINYYRFALLQQNSVEGFLIIQQGAFIKKRIYIPLNKIYGIAEKTNVLQNLFQIVDLEIQTIAKQYLFQGLSKQNFEAIKANLTARCGHLG